MVVVVGSAMGANVSLLCGIVRPEALQRNRKPEAGSRKEGKGCPQ